MAKLGLVIQHHLYYSTVSYRKDGQSRRNVPADGPSSEQLSRTYGFSETQQKRNSSRSTRSHQLTLPKENPLTKLEPAAARFAEANKHIETVEVKVEPASILESELDPLSTFEIKLEPLDIDQSMVDNEAWESNDLTPIHLDESSTSSAVDKRKLQRK